MTRHTKFDAPHFAADIHQNEPKVLADAELATFDPRGAWQAGTTQLRKVIIGWWACEAEAVRLVLQQARELLDAPASRGIPWGDPAPLYEAAHRHARALAHWMCGENSQELWKDAAAAQERALGVASAVSYNELVPASLLCRAMAGMATPSKAPLPEVKNDLAAAIVAAVPEAGDVALLGNAIHAWREPLFAEQPGLALTTLFALAHDRTGRERRSPETCVLAAYVLDSELALPPTLAERRWSNRQEAMVGTERVSFAALEPLLALVGLTRDTNVRPQPDPPEFASWTRHCDLSLEVDWYNAPGDPARLEIRGAAAGRLAGLIVDMLGARPVADPEDALTDMLTVPPRKVPASAPAARARWEILCATIADDGALDQLGARALVRAGLADSDWRVRMAALWAVGHFPLEGIEHEAEKAALPESRFRGLSQDDRRVLLAMRDLAASRSAGLGDRPKKGANGGFVALVANLLDARPRQHENRAQMLMAVLLRLEEAASANLPLAWKTWAT